MVNKRRVAVSSLSASAILFAGLVMHESWSDRPITPVPGDPLTIGPGLTANEDGSPIRPDQRITPVQGIRMAVKQISKDEDVLRRCFGDDTELYQWEWDSFVDLGHNTGPWSICRSSIVPKVKRGDYEAACKTILDFRKVQNRDCSLPKNKKFCGGVWTRRQEMYRLCAFGEYPVSWNVK